LIADEPTTGLDVTIQAQILELIKATQAETEASLFLITHDLGVVAEVCRRVAVMYAGRVVEIAPVTDLFAHPRHPYTIHLLTSTLSPDGRVKHDVAGAAFTGTVDFTVGRETYRAALDAEDVPGLESTMIEVTPGHLVLCRRIERDQDRRPMARSGQTQGSRP